METRVVLHVWTELSSARSYLGLLNVKEAVRGKNVAIEHHAFLTSGGDETSAVEALTTRGLTVTGRFSPDTKKAQELVYAAKAAGSSPEEAAEKGMIMAEALHRAALIDDKDISDLDVLAGIGEQHGLVRDDVRDGLQAGTWSASVDGDVKDLGRLRVTEAPYLVVAGIFTVENLEDPENIAKIVDMAAEQLTEQKRAAEEEARQLFGWRG